MNSYVLDSRFSHVLNFPFISGSHWVNRSNYLLRIEDRGLSNPREIHAFVKSGDASESGSCNAPLDG